MNPAGHKHLPHDIPLRVDPHRETYFIAINCRERFRNQLTPPGVAGKLFETIRDRQEKFIWWPYLFRLMPDHLHALLSFPPSDQPSRLVISKWKEWTAKAIGVGWQDDFFEHRLRHDESRRQNRIPFWKIRCGRNWCRGLKTGRLSVSATAKGRNFQNEAVVESAVGGFARRTSPSPSAASGDGIIRMPEKCHTSNCPLRRQILSPRDKLHPAFVAVRLWPPSHATAGVHPLACEVFNDTGAKDWNKGG